MDGIIRSNPVRRLEIWSLFKQFCFLRLELNGNPSVLLRATGSTRGKLETESRLPSMVSLLSSRGVCPLGESRMLSALDQSIKDLYLRPGFFVFVDEHLVAGRGLVAIVGLFAGENEMEGDVEIGIVDRALVVFGAGADAKVL